MMFQSEIFNYTLSQGSTIGVLTHFWTTGDAGQSSIFFSLLFFLKFDPFQQLTQQRFPIILMEKLLHPFSLSHTWQLELVSMIKLHHGELDGQAKGPNLVVGTTTCKCTSILSYCEVYSHLLVEFHFKSPFVLLANQHQAAKTTK